MMGNLGVMEQNQCDVCGQDPNHCKMWELVPANNRKQVLLLYAIHSRVGTIYPSGEQSRAHLGELNSGKGL